MPQPFGIRGSGREGRPGFTVDANGIIPLGAASVAPVTVKVR